MGLYMSLCSNKSFNLQVEPLVGGRHLHFRVWSIRRDVYVGVVAGSWGFRFWRHGAGWLPHLPLK